MKPLYNHPNDISFDDSPRPSSISGHNPAGNGQFMPYYPSTFPGGDGISANYFPNQGIVLSNHSSKYLHDYNGQSTRFETDEEIYLRGLEAEVSRLRNISAELWDRCNSLSKEHSELQEIHKSQTKYLKNLEEKLGEVSKHNSSAKAISGIQIERACIEENIQLKTIVSDLTRENELLRHEVHSKHASLYADQYSGFNIKAQNEIIEPINENSHATILPVSVGLLNDSLFIGYDKLSEKSANEKGINNRSDPPPVTFNKFISQGYLSSSSNESDPQGLLADENRDDDLLLSNNKISDLTNISSTGTHGNIQNICSGNFPSENNGDLHLQVDRSSKPGKKVNKNQPQEPLNLEVPRSSKRKATFQWALEQCRVSSGLTTVDSQLHSHKEEVAVVMGEVNKVNAELQKKKKILDLYRIQVELYEAGNGREAVRRIVSLVEF